MPITRPPALLTESVELESEGEQLLAGQELFLAGRAVHKGHLAGDHCCDLVSDIVQVNRCPNPCLHHVHQDLYRH